MLYDAFNKRIRQEDCCLYELFQICKTDAPEAFLDLVVTIINENVVDLFEVKGFKDIGIDDYLKDHMQLILETGQDMIWTKLQTCKFIMERYAVDDLLDYFSPTGMTFLSQMIKLGENGVVYLIFCYLQHMFSADVDKPLLRTRLAKLVRQDQSDLSFLDYSFHRKAVQIIDMMTTIKKQLLDDESDNIDFYIPQMIKVQVMLTDKCAADIDIDTSIINDARLMIDTCKIVDRWPSMFDDGYGNYIDAVGTDDLAALKHHYDAFKEMSKVLKKEYFRFFKAEKATHVYIDSYDQLVQAVDGDLMKQKFVTVDVEFCGMEIVGDYKEDESFRHHIACSLQISTLNQNYFIDCLALKNDCMGPVAKLFGSKSIIKVFHGCESDLDAIYRTFGVIVQNIYDTARAAVAIHGLENTPGLGALAIRYLGVHLDKSFQKSIWRVRPLPLPMLEYAITDSFVLLPIFYCQLTELDGLADVDAKSIEIWQHSNNLPKYIKPTACCLKFK